MDNVIEFPGANPVWTVRDTDETPRINPEEIVAAMGDKEFDDIIVIGRLSEGGFYFAASSGSIPEIYWDLQKAGFILKSTMEF